MTAASSLRKCASWRRSSVTSEKWNAAAAHPYSFSLAMSSEPWLPLRDPVFILSPPLSFSSHFAATLGRHPQLYAIPETHLFIAETLHEWWDTCAKTSFNMSHGLVRAVAELFYGEQNETTVQLARAWMRRRLPFTTGYILESLAERVHPRAIVEKSPSMIFHLESMQRVARMFPLARFIHLVEHPRRHCEAVVAAIKDGGRTSSQPRAAMASPARVLLRGARGRILAGACGTRSAAGVVRVKQKHLRVSSRPFRKLKSCASALRTFFAIRTPPSPRSQNRSPSGPTPKQSKL